MKERASRNDRGVTVFAKDFFKYVLGLSDKTVKELMGKIQNRGEMSGMKKAIRDLSGDTYKRLNMALDMAEKIYADANESEEGDEKEDKSEKKVDDKKEEKPVEKKEEKKEVKEGYTFMQHLLTEFQVSVDAEDPQAAMAAVKLANRKGAKRTGRENVLKAAENIKAASKEEGPQKNLKVQIAKQEKILAGLRDRLNRMTGAK